MLPTPKTKVSDTDIFSRTSVFFKRFLASFTSEYRERQETQGESGVRYIPLRHL